MLAAQWRGYLELKRAGLIESLPRMVGVQSVNAPPLLEAFRTNAEHVPTLPYARSKISGINVPFTGDHALAAVHESGGCVVGVRDEEVIAMQARLGRAEGVWVEPASAAPVTAIPDLLGRGLIRSEERIVCIFSGAGFKDAHLAEEEAARVGESELVSFRADDIVSHASRL
jgi:threonine synthase